MDDKQYSIIYLQYILIIQYIINKEGMNIYQQSLKCYLYLHYLHYIEINVHYNTLMTIVYSIYQL